MWYNGTEKAQILSQVLFMKPLYSENNQFTLEVWRIKFEEKYIENSELVFKDAQLKGKSTFN